MLRANAKQRINSKLVLTSTLMASSLLFTPIAQAIIYNPATIGLANALYNLAPTNPTYAIIITQLQGLPTDQSVIEALESLVPPYNNSLAVGSRVGMENVFDIVQIRIGYLHDAPFKHQTYYKQSPRGNNYGDWNSPGFATWVDVIGGLQYQKKRDFASGFNGKNAGAVFGVDLDICDWYAVGIAGSFDRMHMDDRNPNPKDQTIDSWQGTLYGWVELPFDIYIDAILGAARNHFKTIRIINLNQINTDAKASFNGVQKGFQSDVGMTFFSDQHYFSPFMRIKYFHLDLDDYTEYGANILNLSVNNQDTHNFMSGIGFRWSTIFKAGNSCVYFEPEFTGVMGYDFSENDEDTYATFGPGGPLFPVDGFKQGRTVFNFDLGAIAYLTEQARLSVKSNVELRDSFVSYAGSIQYYYAWA